MKANDGSGNIPERDEWKTPKSLFNNLNKQYNFDFDCCASLDNRLTKLYSNCFENMDYLHNKICWMNPPFSKAKEMFKQFFKATSRGVAIYRCDNFETVIWQDIIFKNCDWIFIPYGRIVYEGMDGNGSRFPSALIGVGVKPPKNLLGVCLKLRGQDNGL